MCKALVKRGKFSFLKDFNISTIQNFCRELGCEVSEDAARLDTPPASRRFWLLFSPKKSDRREFFTS